MDHQTEENEDKLLALGTQDRLNTLADKRARQHRTDDFVFVHTKGRSDEKDGDICSQAVEAALKS